MKSCKIHHKIRYIVRVARFFKKLEDVKTYVGRACKNRSFLRGSAGGKQPKKTDNFHRIFVDFWSKKRSKKRPARKRSKQKKKTLRAHGLFAGTAFFAPPGKPRALPRGPKRVPKSTGGGPREVTEKSDEKRGRLVSSHGVLRRLRAKRGITER